MSRARLLQLAVAAALVIGLMPWGGAGPAPAAAPVAAQVDGGAEVIVVLEDGTNPRAAARELGVTPTYIYRDVFTGFAGTLPAATTAAARRSARVELISPDLPVAIAAQQLPTGVDRVEADANAWADIDNRGPKIDADVAVLDTGIKRLKDLRVRRGRACLGRRSTRDNNGHGTHVAGIIGAKDNRREVVGVAPGVRVWAVKVLRGNGVGSRSSVICGLDWVYKHRATIDVVNMSLGGPGRDGGDCDQGPWHLAVCRVVEADIPVIVSAGNESGDAANVVPAAWDEVITVSAIADSDGEPGGAGRPTCLGNQDDTFASYSNFGADVDIAAPGDCIRSLRRKGGTKRISGTSQAAPHVSGAAALFVANNPGATEAEIRTWLLTEAALPQDDPIFGFGGDPDNFPEPILYLGD